MPCRSGPADGGSYRGAHRPAAVPASASYPLNGAAVSGARVPEPRAVTSEEPIAINMESLRVLVRTTYADDQQVIADHPTTPEVLKSLVLAKTTSPGVRGMANPEDWFSLS